MPFSRLIDHFEARADLCKTVADLAALTSDAARELGFDYFALLHHRSLDRPGPHLIRIDGYPSGWAQELAARLRHCCDPVHLASERTNAGFRWTALPAMVRLDARQREILRASAGFGLGEGFTIPANVPGEPIGSCSFAVRLGRQIPAGRLSCAEIIGARAFQAARRLCGYPAAGLHPHLSRRELQCLELVAAGKSDYEIGVILGISTETAHQYVKRARAAYDVISRAQLVAHGLRDARISFEDAIPQSG